MILSLFLVVILITCDKSHLTSCQLSNFQKRAIPFKGLGTATESAKDLGQSSNALASSLNEASDVFKARTPTTEANPPNVIIDPIYQKTKLTEPSINPKEGPITPAKGHTSALNQEIDLRRTQLIGSDKQFELIKTNKASKGFYREIVDRYRRFKSSIIRIFSGSPPPSQNFKSQQLLLGFFDHEYEDMKRAMSAKSNNDAIVRFVDQQVTSPDAVSLLLGKKTFDKAKLIITDAGDLYSSQAFLKSTLVRASEGIESSSRGVKDFPKKYRPVFNRFKSLIDAGKDKVDDLMVERVFYVFLFLYTALNKNLPSKLKSLSAFHDIWGPGKVYQPEGAELKEVAVQWNMNTDQARVFAKSIGDIQDGLAKYSKILADKPITKRFGRETHEMIVYDDKIHKAESDLLSIKATLSHVATGLPRTNLNDVLIKIRTSDVVKSIKSDLKNVRDPHTRLVLMGNILPKGENPRRVTFPNLPMQEIGLKSNAETLNRLRNLEKATLELLKEERENDIVAAEYLSWLKAIPDKNLQMIKSEMKQYTEWTRSLNVDVTPNPATNPVEGRATNPATNPVTQTKPVTDPSTSNPTK